SVAHAEEEADAEDEKDAGHEAKLFKVYGSKYRLNRQKRFPSDLLRHRCAEARRVHCRIDPARVFRKQIHPKGLRILKSLVFIMFRGLARSISAPPLWPDLRLKAAFESVAEDSERAARKRDKNMECCSASVPRRAGKDEVAGRRSWSFVGRRFCGKSVRKEGRGNPGGFLAYGRQVAAEF